MSSYIACVLAVQNRPLFCLTISYLYVACEAWNIKDNPFEVNKRFRFASGTGSRTKIMFDNSTIPKSLPLPLFFQGTFVSFGGTISKIDSQQIQVSYQCSQVIPQAFFSRIFRVSPKIQVTANYLKQTTLADRFTKMFMYMKAHTPKIPNTSWQGVWCMISGLKTTARTVFVCRIYRICFTKSSPSPPLQWVATEDGGTAPQMTKGRWSALQIYRTVHDVADTSARKTCWIVQYGQERLYWIRCQNQSKW